MWTSGIVVWFLAAVILCLDAATANATKRAFVVGIDRYEHFDPQRQLTRAVADAMAVATKLRELGFTVTEVTDRTAPPNKAGHSVVDQSLFYDRLEVFARSIKIDDTVVLFFSGHGVQRDGENYLLTNDAPQPGLGSELYQLRRFVPLQQVMQTIKRRAPRYKIVILDACRDDPYDLGSTKSAGDKAGLAAFTKTSDTFVMYAAAEDQRALDRFPPPAQDTEKTSPYTRTLLKWLDRPHVPLLQIATGVRKEVAALVARHANGRRQEPSYSDGMLVSDEFCLGSADGKCPPAPKPQLTEPAMPPVPAPVPIAVPIAVDRSPPAVKPPILMAPSQQSDKGSSAPSPLRPPVRPPIGSNHPDRGSQSKLDAPPPPP